LRNYDGRRKVNDRKKGKIAEGIVKSPQLSAYLYSNTRKAKLLKE